MFQLPWNILIGTLNRTEWINQPPPSSNYLINIGKEKLAVVILSCSIITSSVDTTIVESRIVDDETSTRPVQL